MSDIDPANAAHNARLDFNLYVKDWYAIRVIEKGVIYYLTIGMVENYLDTGHTHSGKNLVPA